MRARMALALSGTAVELREVLLRDKPPSLREVSPKATVPVLITDEQQVLEESLDIMLWTLQDQQECFALGGGAAAQREFIESFDQQFKPLLDQYKYHRTGTEPPASYYRDQCADWLQRLDAMLQPQPYLLGEQPQLLDMALLPFVRQFAHVDLTWFEQAPYLAIAPVVIRLASTRIVHIGHEQIPTMARGYAGHSLVADATQPQQLRERQMQQWIIGIVSVAAVLLLAWGVSIVGADQGKQYADVAVFVWCGVFAFGVQWLLFIHAWLAHTEKFFDLAGSLTYVTIFIAAVVLSAAYDPRSLIIAAAIIVWALRLGPFLYFRIKNSGGDRRFHSIRNSFPTFFMTWTLQGAWVYLTSCAALAAVTSSNTVGLDAMFVVGFGIWAFGFAIEVIADRQKTAFRADPDNAHRFIQFRIVGLVAAPQLLWRNHAVGGHCCNGLPHSCGLAGADLTGTDLGGVTNDRHQRHAHA